MGGGWLLYGFYTFIPSRSPGEGQRGLDTRMRFLSDPGRVGILIPSWLFDVHHCGRSLWLIWSNWLTEPSVVREPNSELSSQGAKQNPSLNHRTEGELQSYAFFPLNKVFPASRWKDVPYRASVIGSQPDLWVFHSWHQDKLIFFTKLTPITFIFIAHNQLMGYNLIQCN